MQPIKSGEVFTRADGSLIIVLQSRPMGAQGYRPAPNAENQVWQLDIQGFGEAQQERLFRQRKVTEQVAEAYAQSDPSNRVLRD